MVKREQLTTGRTEVVNTLQPWPRARTSVRDSGPGLVSDEVREEVGEHAEQRETTDAVTGEHPGSAAFVGTCGGSRGLLRRSNDRGPIFHAKNLQRKDRGASTGYASRLPSDVAGQDLCAILPRFYAGGMKKCDWGHVDL